MLRLNRTIALAVLTLVIPASAHSRDAPLDAQIVDALNTLYGVHPGFRANHAKGIVVEGYFTPSPHGPALSSSPLFAGAVLPVIVRFSDAGGMPAIRDGSARANPHGMAIKFQMADGAESDIVLNSLKFFPVATPADFRDLQLAIASSPAGEPPSPHMRAFLGCHPAVARAAATVRTPASFATEEYSGINAFVFTNAAGEKQAFRYIVTPEEVFHLSEREAAAQSPDFLIRELPVRLALGPVTFNVRAQLAAPGDQTRDATVPWPDDRPVVDLGTLTITNAAVDSLEIERRLLFLPGRLTEGISFSDDPLLPARDAAYAVSFGRRIETP
jgi:catalase